VQPGDIDYLDHSVLITTDLDGVADAYEKLGFLLSPASRHMAAPEPGAAPEPAGTANRCAYFGQNYLELIGVVDRDSNDPWHVLPLIERYEGLRGMALGCSDSDVVKARLDEAGIPCSGVISLERPVETEDGVKTAKFRSIHISREVTPEGSVLTGEHLTIEYVHQKRFLDHPNGANELIALTIIVEDAELDAYVDRYTKIIGAAPADDGPRKAFQLRLGRLELVPASKFDEILPGETAPVLPFIAAHTVKVADLAAAKSLIEGNGVATVDLDDGFFVGAADAFGGSVVFVGA
jgi:hypothetical protein